VDQYAAANVNYGVSALVGQEKAALDSGPSAMTFQGPSSAMTFQGQAASHNGEVHLAVSKGVIKVEYLCYANTSMGFHACPLLHHAHALPLI